MDNYSSDLKICPEILQSHRKGTTQEDFASELTLCHPLVLQRIFKDFQFQPTNQMP